MSLRRFASALMVSVAALVLSSAPLCALDDYVAFWSLDEASGTVIHDSSPNGFHGVMSGATWVTGVAGSALEFAPGAFAGIPDAVGYPPLIGSLTQGTISVWFRTDPVTSDFVLRPVFYLGDDTGGLGHSGLVIELGHAGEGTPLYFTVYDDDGHTLLCFDTVFDLGVDAWYHIAVVVGADFNTAYLNGEELVNRNYNAGGPSDRGFFSDVVDKVVCWVGRGFAKQVTESQFFKGAIDELRIYDRPLTSDEVWEYYSSVAAGLQAPFRRGDANGDGVIDLGDAVHTLGALFLPGASQSSCLDAADANDDGAIDLADPIYTLGALFLPGAPGISAPYPGCGDDPTVDSLSCAGYPDCR